MKINFDVAIRSQSSFTVVVCRYEYGDVIFAHSSLFPHIDPIHSRRSLNNLSSYWTCNLPQAQLCNFVRGFKRCYWSLVVVTLLSTLVSCSFLLLIERCLKLLLLLGFHFMFLEIYIFFFGSQCCKMVAFNNWDEPISIVYLPSWVLLIEIRDGWGLPGLFIKIFIFIKLLH